MPKKLPARMILTDEELAGIGAVAVHSAYFEAEIETYIRILCGLTKEQATLFTATMQMDKKADVFRALVKLRINDPAALKEFDALMSEVKSIIVDRNTIIHGLWLAPKITVDHESPTPIREGEASARKAARRNKQPRVFRASGLINVARRFSDLGSAISRTMLKHELHMTELQRKLFPPIRARTARDDPKT